MRKMREENVEPENEEQVSYARKQLRIRDDWQAVIYLIISILGFLVTILDFWKLQNLHIEISLLTLLGGALVIFGGVLRVVSRFTLKRAGFGLVNSAKLQILEDHKLITDGVYKYIRHPLYLGEISRNIGFGVLFSSLYGVILLVIGCIFLIIRIEIEEKMLIGAFGQDYIDYRERTKKLIPLFY